MSAEDMMKSLAQNINTIQNNLVQFQQETKSSIRNLENQVGQITQAFSKLEARDSGKLPSQTIANPTTIFSAVTLRSGRPLHVVRGKETDDEQGDVVSEVKQRSRFEYRDRGLLSDGIPREELQTRDEGN